ncbi:D-alanyl-D-alanine carboxypeptidase/D-alanyl-D-alanine endopeptidase [Streptomyces alkaliphilus]|uniref:D-alanyl-D-alanine carboxypeptidase/D-alanyl-D-alanine endopeptidase n=1 Tax=Streptomyces alkaliphilus TaxID=1472722 RepID=UPI002B1F8315|nr:D-alanyl-D-alanine carboxypeptidase/D-alanyl-D-alanine-endopeptidase [Streptomyces alkaliphilus]
MRETIRRHRSAHRPAAVAATVGVAAAMGAILLSGPWDAGQREAERARAAVVADAPTGSRDTGTAGDRSGGSRPGEEPPVAAPSAGPVLEPLGPRVIDFFPGAEPTPADRDRGIAGNPAPVDPASVLDPLLDDPALGPDPAASVIDLADGRPLYTRNGDRSMAPASTVKAATAAAALHTLGPDHRLTTRVVLDPDRERVILVGGGDTGLGHRELGRLAARTAEALRERGIDAVGVGWDAGPGKAPSHHPIGVNHNIAPFTPLMVNGGRLDDSTTGPAPRSADPAADAAGAFVRLLKGEGVEVRGSSAAPRPVPGKAEEVAVHRSAPLAVLVEEMLTDSDNDMAESLARAVGEARGHGAGLAGATRGVTEALTDIGLPMDGVRVADGSGLDRSGRMTTDALVGLLGLAADPGRPELRTVLTGLPVAGFTGTLDSRYPDVGAGVVRAKTGTLTGVNALAGTVVDTEGRVLAFAFLTEGTVSATAAQDALDRAAAALSRCGCG